MIEMLKKTSGCLGSGTEITGTPALVDLIGVDHRFMPVDFVYIIASSFVTGALAVVDGGFDAFSI